jgi:hypothetical protein
MPQRKVKIIRAYERGDLIEAQVEIDGETLFVQTHRSNLKGETVEELRQSLAEKALWMLPPKKEREDLTGEVTCRQKS